jgi:hypothetical protein
MRQPYAAAGQADGLAECWFQGENNPSVEGKQPPVHGAVTCPCALARVRRGDRLIEDAREGKRVDLRAVEGEEGRKGSTEGDQTESIEARVGNKE